MELTDRKKKVLRSIVDLYIRTAEPVGSKAIAELPDMNYSSATIRNEMSDLEEMGYLAQPQVSAGRVPSHKAYRLYVDGLLEGAFPREEAAREYFSRRVRQMEDVITCAAHALSEITRYTAVVMMPKQL